MKKVPTYLRIVATTRCNNSCPYCHREGDLQLSGTEKELPSNILRACLHAAVLAGISKIKFLGGEPFLRRDLPEIVKWIRKKKPDADISIITAGVVPTSKLFEVWNAGLSRINISVHGFTRRSFSRRNRSPEAYEMRNEFIREVILGNRAPLKINYVYSSAADEADLAELLNWAAKKKLYISVLDNLSMQLSWKTVTDVVRRLRGEPDRTYESQDPNSLPTLVWEYYEGLRVEIKNKSLGDFSPYRSCTECKKKSECREGIFALRLTHDGMLQPCMHRPELSLPLSDIVTSTSVLEASRLWKEYVTAL